MEVNRILTVNFMSYSSSLPGDWRARRFCGREVVWVRRTEFNELWTGSDCAWGKDGRRDSSWRSWASLAVGINVSIMLGNPKNKVNKYHLLHTKIFRAINSCNSNVSGHMLIEKSNECCGLVEFSSSGWNVTQTCLVFLVVTHHFIVSSFDSGKVTVIFFILNSDKIRSKFWAYRVVDQLHNFCPFLAFDLLCNCLIMLRFNDVSALKICLQQKIVSITFKVTSIKISSSATV